MSREKIILTFFLFAVLLLADCTQKYHKADKIIIQFASWGSQSEVEIIKPILTEFEKENPTIEVDFIHIPQNYFQKIHLLFASNLAPDVLFINNLYLPVYANAGVLEEMKIESNIFFKKALQALSYNRKLYAIPRDVSELVIYYNKDIFRKYGVAYPDKNWSFEDFLKITQRLTKDINNDEKTDIWGINFEKEPLYYLPYLMSEGGGILSDNHKGNIINASASQKGLKFYADLRNKYHVAPTDAESASATMAQLFLQGKLAMYLSGRWMVPKFRSDAKFDWDVVNFPTGDKGSIVPLDASGWAIAKSSKHKNEALKLINYLSSKKSIVLFTKSGLIVPARIDVAENEFIKDKQKPLSSKVFINIINTAKPTPVSVNYAQIQDDLKEKTEYIFD